MIENCNSWKVVQPLHDDDIVLDWFDNENHILEKTS